MRLETLGFPRVYDFAGGKRRWGSFGLPRAGTSVPEHTAGDVARSDVPTCRLDERLTDVRRRVREAGWDACIVVHDDGVVLGRLRRTVLASDAEGTVEESMTPGPSTVRPSIGTDALRERMRDRNVKSYLVTTPDGRLVGLVRLNEIEQSAR